MLNIYEEFGYFKEGLHTVTLKGMSGQEQIAQIMADLRKEEIASFADLKTISIKDYDASVSKDMATGEESEITLPKSNVLYFELENDSWCCARPSGTEPKIKFYMGVKGTSLEDANEKLETLKAAVLSHVKVD